MFYIMQYKANSVNCVCEYIQHLKDIASTNDITSSDALKQVWLSRVNYHTHCTIPPCPRHRFHSLPFLWI